MHGGLESFERPNQTGAIPRVLPTGGAPGG